MEGMIDVGAVRHRITTFDQRHGGREASVQSSGGWIYYRNGAKREVEPLGALVEPPTDEYELAVAKLNFHRTNLKRATDEFAHLKEQLRHTTRDDAGLARLKKLKASLPKLQREVNEAETAVALTQQGQRILQEKQSRAEESQRIRDWQKEVAGVAGVAAEDE